MVHRHPPIILRPGETFRDHRGELRHLLDAAFGSALVMTSVKGAIRGNHYHHTDYHYCWLQRGGLIYAHRPVGSSAAPREWVIQPGQIFYTPPRYEHVMYFIAASTVVVLARNPRTMARYEEDTVRIAPLPVPRP